MFWSAGSKEWLRLTDSSRVQEFGSRVGKPEFQTSSDKVSGGEPVVEEVLSPSLNAAQLGQGHGQGLGQGQGLEQTEEWGGMEQAEAEEWATSLVPGDMLDARNKHGVWFEVP